MDSVRLSKAEALLQLERLFKSEHCPHCGSVDIAEVGQAGQACTDEELKDSWNVWQCKVCQGKWQLAVHIKWGYAIELCEKGNCNLCENYEVR